MGSVVTGFGLAAWLWKKYVWLYIYIYLAQSSLFLSKKLLFSYEILANIDFLEVNKWVKSNIANVLIVIVPISITLCLKYLATILNYYY